MQENYIKTEREVIESAVKESILALKDLLSVNTIDMERQPNSENKLYLSIIERIQEQEKFRLINMPSTKEANVIKTGKPAHLAVLKFFAKNIKKQMTDDDDVMSDVKSNNSPSRIDTRMDSPTKSTR